MDFNVRFQKTWQRISLVAYPLADKAFVFYLKAFNFDISIMIQSLGGNTLPDTYELTVQV